jgi:oxygen-independent coproporphyrinogen-3 oxidase
VHPAEPEPVPAPVPESATDPGAGLYIHVPFCTSVCPYCDFAVTIAGEERRRAWVDGIVREAEMHADIGLAFDTVYLGGGTPSSLTPRQLAQVSDGIGRHLALDPQAMLFLEANPEDVSRGKTAAWRDLGVSFVSLGVQSFDDADLEFLGRRHGAVDARRAVETLCDAGFRTVSVDLIYGLDGRSEDHWRRQLERALDLGVDHLSCYQLTVHEETVLGRRVAGDTATEIGDREMTELFFLTHEVLADAGFEGYEVSNFASAPEHRSAHNQKYWDHTPYLGLGPSAHSFAGGRRWWNRKKLRLWQAAVSDGKKPVEDEERPTVEQLVLEALMLGFRTSAGVDLERLRAWLGFDLLSNNQDVVGRLCASGHIEVDGSRLRPTLAGLAIADTLARSFTV